MGERKEKIAAATALSLIAAILIAPHIQWQRAPLDPNVSNCVSDLKLLALASIMYQSDNDDRYGPTARWMDNVREYIKSEDLFHDPDRTGKGYGYAHNSLLSGVAPADLADIQNTPMIYDSSSDQRNASDPFTSLPYPSRHTPDSHTSGKNVIAYTDGHSRSLPATPNSKTP